MITAEVRLGTDGRTVELVPDAAELAEVQRQLRQLDPPIRATRGARRLRLDLRQALLLRDSGALVLRWTDDAAQAIDSRRQIAASATEVEDRMREIAEVDVALLRSHLPGSDLVARLDDHQVRNVAVMTVPSGWGACVFDEQGTGKTVTAITAFDLLVERDEADVLVVISPKSMVAEWAAEFHRFVGDLYHVVVVAGSRREKASALHDGADVLVTNYETAVALRDDLRLLARKCRVVLAVDESYNVKNADAARSAAVAEIREWCVRCFVLCGTPAPNAPGDLVAQFDLMDLGYTFQGTDAREVMHDGDAIRTAIASRGIFTRNLKDEVLPDLPDRKFSEVRLGLAPIQSQLYRDALDGLVHDLQAVDDDEFRSSYMSFLERRNVLLRICSNPVGLVSAYEEVPAKLEALDEMLPRYASAGEKVVLWSFYRASLDVLAARYAHLGLVRIDGSVSDVRTRRESVRLFQEDDDTMIFLGNPAAAGAGLTLHRARIAVYESLSNQAAHFMQSLDRIHRRGQTREVEYVVLLGRGTLEEVEYQRLLTKTDAQADILGDPRPERVTRDLMLAELLQSQTFLG